MSTPRVSTHIARKIVALFDIHAPQQCKLDGVLSFIKERQPTDLVLGGDIVDMQFCSHWNDTLFSTIGLEKVEMLLAQEFVAGREVLQQIVNALPKNCNKWYLPGNHEFFAIEACVKYPQLMGGLHLGDKLTFKSDLTKLKKQALADLLRRFLRTDDLGISVLPYEKELRIGKLTFVHGHEVTSLAALQKRYPGQSVVIGHHHTEQVLTAHSGGSGHNAYQYTMTPALCDLTPGYLKSSSTRWLNGFYSCDVLSNGTFSGHVIKVLDGCIIENGKIYK